MHKTVLSIAAVFAFSHGITFAQNGPTDATYIMHSEVEAVLKAGAARTPPAVDQTLRVLDMGKYAMSVAVIHRGATAAPAAGAGRGGAGGGAGRGAVPAAQSCGLTEAPAGAQMSPPGMIAHDDTTETYIVISGSGTLVTGGQVVNGRRSGPDSEVTKS
jgi:hypothetical protein